MRKRELNDMLVSGEMTHGDAITKERTVSEGI